MNTAKQRTYNKKAAMILLCTLVGIVCLPISLGLAIAAIISVKALLKGEFEMHE